MRVLQGPPQCPFNQGERIAKAFILCIIKKAGVTAVADVALIQTQRRVMAHKQNVNFI